MAENRGRRLADALAADHLWEVWAGGQARARARRSAYRPWNLACRGGHGCREAEMLMLTAPAVVGGASAVRRMAPDLLVPSLVDRAVAGVIGTGRTILDDRLRWMAYEAVRDLPSVLVDPTERTPNPMPPLSWHLATGAALGAAEALASALATAAARDMSHSAIARALGVPGGAVSALMNRDNQPWDVLRATVAAFAGRG